MFLRQKHSTLGSVVPLALFAEIKCFDQLVRKNCKSVLAQYFWEGAGQRVRWKVGCILFGFQSHWRQVTNKRHYVTPGHNFMDTLSWVNCWIVEASIAWISASHKTSCIFDSFIPFILELCHPVVIRGLTSVKYVTWVHMEENLVCQHWLKRRHNFCRGKVARVLRIWQQCKVQLEKTNSSNLI